MSIYRVCIVLLASSIFCAVGAGAATLSTAVTSAGNAPAHTASVSKGAITAHIVASRTSGVAPLAVHFDATGTTGEARAFHTLHYAWDFADSNSGTWPTTGHPRRFATGPVAAHVFERPGDYQVQLSVRNAGGTSATTQVMIHVDDPEAVFAATTTCVATGTNFAGCPAGAMQVTTSSTASLAALLLPGRRVLLRRGDSWSLTQTLELDDGPSNLAGHLGAFGTCTGMDARGICSNAPRLDPAAGRNEVMRVEGNWRVADLSMTGPEAQGGNAIDIWPGTGTLLLRLRVRGFGLGIGAADLETRGDQLALVSNDVGAGYTYQVAVGSERLMILGNHFHDSQVSHVLRIWQAFKGVISENVLENSSLGSDLGRHALKLHGIGQAVVSAGEPMTEYIVVSDNTFGASPPWPVSVGPENNTELQPMRNVLFERNLWRSKGPHFGTTAVSTALHCSALGDITVRNNVFDAEDAGDYFAAVDISRSPQFSAQVTNVHVYNNTVYRDPGATHIAVARVEANVVGASVRNNLGFAPGAIGSALEYDFGTSTVNTHNLFGALSFVANPTLPQDFIPAPSPLWVDAGTSGLVIEDFTGRLRMGATDLGAFELQALFANGFE